MSNAVLHRLIHGYTSRGAAYTGLLEKCPAIAYTDRTIISEDEMTGHSTRRRTNAYTFDHDLYGKWMAGGAVWLDDDPGPGPGRSGGITAVRQQDYGRFRETKNR